MPLPEPKTDEEHDEFIERCMSDDTMQEDYPDDDQRLAVCETQWGKDEKAAKPQVERRFSSAALAPVEIEQRQGQSPQITGFAAIYYDGTPETEYELSPGVRERIRAGAFSALLKDGTDTRGLFNHEVDNLLGRTTNGTLKLRSTRKGLSYAIDPPDTQMGRDVATLVERRDVTGSSFSFIIAQDGEKTTKEGDVLVRTITKVERLFDVGPVVFPAYKTTLADLRSVQHGGTEATENGNDTDEGKDKSENEHEEERTEEPAAVEEPKAEKPTVAEPTAQEPDAVEDSGRGDQIAQDAARRELFRRLKKQADG